ncbi:DNA cytosine methyltransferase [Pectobacterium aquaticum]|uniref:DNA cytosine methyltransferase n=1 Tax=Pectobacterium aquaticum TaxID=2204145 RepID=UPI000E27A7BE|nr:DNA cytosine methyltransferase [Pectobacterium aquaticum]RRO03825.1 DNA cytosine methyltransferase [Pectobacterium aquaticum]
MISAYYNEIDPFAAQWLRNLIAGGHIAPGDVDERSIEDVAPDELRNYTQCHFFAGIGVWSYALRRAGWPDDKPVWTGSCPCQPFSAAGKGDGFADERHLWPAFFHLIEQCKPPIVFGEQVASKAIDAWIDLVQADLEALGYAFASTPFPSAGVGAPHLRDRNFWVANSSVQRLQRGFRCGAATTKGEPCGHCSECGNSMSLGDAEVVPLRAHDGQQRQSGEKQGAARGHGFSRNQSVASAVNGIWRDADWLLCRDGKWRPVEPGSFPLADGVTNRVGRLRAYGNAINAEAAKTFIETFSELVE